MCASTNLHRPSRLRFSYTTGELREEVCRLNFDWFCTIDGEGALEEVAVSFLHKGCCYLYRCLYRGFARKSTGNHYKELLLCNNFPVQITARDCCSKVTQFINVEERNKNNEKLIFRT